MCLVSARPISESRNVYAKMKIRFVNVAQWFWKLCFIVEVVYTFKLKNLDMSLSIECRILGFSSELQASGNLSLIFTRFFTVLRRSKYETLHNRAMNNPNNF